MTRKHKDNERGKIKESRMIYAEEELRGKTIRDLRKLLDKFEEETGTDEAVIFAELVWTYYDSAEIEYTMEWIRDETDEEWAKRVEKNKKRRQTLEKNRQLAKKKQEEYERQEYERLRKKFERKE